MNSFDNIFCFCIRLLEIMYSEYSDKAVNGYRWGENVQFTQFTFGENLHLRMLF